MPFLLPPQQVPAQESTTETVSTIDLLQLRTQALEKLSSGYKRLAHDNEVLKFKLTSMKEVMENKKRTRCLGI